MTSTVILIAGLTLGAATQQGGVPQQDEQPQFSTTVSLMEGTWLLDEQLSQDPREVLREAIGEAGRRGPNRMGGGVRPGGGGGRPGGGGGRPGGGSAPGGRPPGGAGRSMPDAGQAGRPGLGWAASNEVEITSKDPGLMMANDSGLLRYVVADGLWAERKLPDGSRAEIKAEWAEGTLHITSVADRGFKSSEVWEVLPEADRLVLIIQFESPRLDEPVSVRRVFNKAAEPIAGGR